MQYTCGTEPVPGYVLVDRIGKGSFGEVWEVRGPGNKPLALKIVELQSGTDRRELRSMVWLRNVDHAHLVHTAGFWVLDTDNQVIDPNELELELTEQTTRAGEHPRTPQRLLIAMALCERSLNDRLQECTQQGTAGIPAAELLPYMEDAAKGIDYLNSPVHRIGDRVVSILHRDIKPANILLLGGAAMICDCGVAGLLEASSVTASATIGTLAYIAPELIEAQHTNRHSDQYSLAITYYHLRTGRLPFPDGAGTATVVKCHITGTLQLDLLPPGERHVIARATACNPDQRYDNCVEMVRAIRAAVAGGEVPGWGVRRLLAVVHWSRRRPPRLNPGPPPSLATPLLSAQHSASDTQYTLFATPRERPPAGTKSWRHAPRKVPASRVHRIWLFLGALAGCVLLARGLGLPVVEDSRQAAVHPEAETPIDARSLSTHRISDEHNTLPTAIVATRDNSSFDPAWHGGAGGHLIDDQVGASPTEPPAEQRINWLSDAESPPEPLAGTTYTTPLGIELTWIPAGDFLMGSPASESLRNSDEDQVRVTITRGFWLGRYEVTQQHWQQVMTSTPWQDQPFAQSGPEYPATYVSWHDVISFCEKLTTRERLAGHLREDEEYRLPTEAEWEYACRAGTSTAFCFGEHPAELHNYAWWGGSGPSGNTALEQYPHEIGRKQANLWGLHDLHGNTWEWCRDNYASQLVGGVDPLTVRNEAERVIRGGSWFYDGSYCRSACRDKYPADHRTDDVGFRLVRCRIDQASGKAYD